MSTSRPLLPTIVLRRHEERRLQRGHLWVYSNEVDVKQTPLKGFAPGDPVTVLAQGGQPLGSGYINPHSLICARLISYRRDVVLDRRLLDARLRAALELRESLFDRPSYRLVHGEGDSLPGLVVDRYDDILVVQISTAGIERLRDDLLAALVELLAPRAILLRNDTPLRGLEGLDTAVETVHGTLPETLTVDEGGLRFEVPASDGQKTGWFFDQRPNRDRLIRYAEGRRVLDLFSYVGAWGLRAAAAGANEVLCVDSSAPALARLEANATANGVADRVVTRRGDVFEVLRKLRDAGERYETVVVDPPALIKRRKDHKAGLEAYRRLNRRALQVLAPGGILLTSSCSYHLSRDELRVALERAARQVDVDLQIIEQGHQGPDHPVHPAIPETDYLKCLVARRLPA
ncbi:MAG: RlmI/RlmK family 23S rRNA methyltransferase [Gammaproteobacteria bacterium]|nr:MAG: RlmI/RlmK family 23S rRNA methyltransferase [Gammaproteobacteria bacterium]